MSKIPQQAEKHSTSSRQKKRARPVAGSLIAKDMLYRLREMRKSEAQQGISGMLHDSTAEIEMWEDLIHAHVRGFRHASREELRLDGATIAALDDIHSLDGRPSTWAKNCAAEFRREFALHAIQKVAQAFVNMDKDRRPRGAEWVVTIREMTDREREMELLAMEAALPPGKNNDRK